VSQEGAEVQSSVDAAQQELAELRGRMAVIKEEAVAEVDKKWGSSFRTKDVFDLKVAARLSGNKEYRSLQRRVEEAEAALAAESDTAPEAGSAR
jgi:hypothetical protein